MEFLKPVAHSAKKALSLKNDQVFKLLVLMTALLGWVAAMGAGGILGLENVYKEWQLAQKSKVSVYLLADSSEKALKKMNTDLKKLQGVEKIHQLTSKETRALLAPYFQEEDVFPLPVVLDVEVTNELDRVRFDSKVFHHFGAAEIDDARDLLNNVSQGVRVAQFTAFGLALLMFGIVTMLVSVTVRAGLKEQFKNLTMLQHIGATDSFIVHLVVRQVFTRSLFGWLIAAVCAVLLLILAATTWEKLWLYITPSVWIGVVVVPLFLPLIAFLSAWSTARKMVK